MQHIFEVSQIVLLVIVLIIHFLRVISILFNPGFLRAYPFISKQQISKTQLLAYYLFVMVVIIYIIRQLV